MTRATWPWNADESDVTVFSYSSYLCFSLGYHNVFTFYYCYWMHSGRLGELPALFLPWHGVCLFFSGSCQFNSE